MQKVICGCLKITLLFYEKILEDLEAYGFKINPYDSYAEIFLGGKQLTVCWHVDDLNILCVKKTRQQKLSCGYIMNTGRFTDHVRRSGRGRHTGSIFEHKYV